MNIYNFTLITLSSFIVIFLMSNTMAEQMTGWSFDEHPHPLTRDLTDEEHAFREMMIRKTEITGRSCKTNVELDYQIYLRRYPGYVKSGNSESNLRNWKFHFVANSYKLNAYCLTLQPTDKMWKALRRPGIGRDFFYCGFYSRPPATAVEHDIKKYIDDLVEYAKTGSHLAIDNLLEQRDRFTFLDINRDVEYYFRKISMSSAGPSRGVENTSHLEPLLSMERKIFIDEAAMLMDFQAVLDTSPPCSPRGKGPIKRI
ncbi:MAG: hypothetical protein QM488_15065 [Rhizobiaceae bacterium]